MTPDLIAQAALIATWDLERLVREHADHEQTATAELRAAYWQRLAEKVREERS